MRLKSLTRYSLVWAVLFSSLIPCPSSLHATTSLGSLTLTAVKCRIFTPNGDGRNDKARFEFDNPEQLPITGSVYDLSGARVSDLQPGSDPTTVMLWDGKNVDGQTVAGGIYIYQIVFNGKTATGTVVVAR
jgi:hypothetical protein